MRARGRRCFNAFDAEQAGVVVGCLWWTLEQAGGQDPIIEQAPEHYSLH